ncbi:MAG: GTPase activating protein (SH3 domain) binding protein [Thelocarpon impressellum]|nr:MAG: GTPase activating protein (SH3 domain) binding protein [Thelocarpon impressellum]
MAAARTQVPVNGTYGSQGHHYSGDAEANLSSQPQGNATTASVPTPDSFGSQNANVPSSSGPTAADSNKHTEIPKDQVGWHFVEQYYLNLSRSPNKLHLFYNKRSQFVWGVEAEKVAVSVGRTAIADRIKELEFQDCKVRVLNVDSQASFSNILIQVIGEMSNKSAPHRKFVQTFVLAEQPNGYFVLNDIFRYINDEEEDEAELDGFQDEEAVHSTHGYDDLKTMDPEPKTLTSSGDLIEQRHDAEVVDKHLEEKLLKENGSKTGHAKAPTSVSKTNGTLAEHDADANQAEDAPVAAVEAKADDAVSTEAVESALEREVAEPERPKDPEPTPIVSPDKPASTPASQASQSAPPKPAAPKTWANLVAAARSAAPAAPSSTSSTPPAPSQPKVAPPPAQPAQSAAPGEPLAVQSPKTANVGWQTAGNEHAKRQVRPQSISGTGEKENVLAYVKNVTEKVEIEALKSTLAKYGDLAYFDVSRPKNCAFVEFATAAGYNAAVTANPHHIGGEQIYVEERRPRSGAYGGAGYNPRGGSGRGRGGDGKFGGPGRGGFQKDGGRGGSYGPGRGRGGHMAPRGRGFGDSQ